MSYYLIHCFHQNPAQRDEYFRFREKRLALLPTCSGRLVTLFQPEGHADPGTPDEVQVLEFPTPGDLLAYREALTSPVLAALKSLGVTHSLEFSSEVEIPSDSVMATIISKRPVELQPPKLAEQLTARFPLPVVSQLHPAQRQVDLEGTIKQPRNKTQERLSGLVLKWQAAQDRRAIFAHTYCLMTGNMLAALDAGEFHDREWVSRLLDNFAERYFEALDKYEQTPLIAPHVWRVAFEVATNPEAFVVQHLLLGVNAHINYDLANSLVAVLEDEWVSLDRQARQRRYEDHTHVNEVIEVTFEEAQELVIARYSPSLDRLMQTAWEFDDLMVSGLIRGWRDHAWEHAVGMLDVHGWDARQAEKQRMEYEALQRADMIMLRQGPMKMRLLF